MSLSLAMTCERAAAKGKPDRSGIRSKRFGEESAYLRHRQCAVIAWLEQQIVNTTLLIQKLGKDVSESARVGTAARRYSEHHHDAQDISLVDDEAYTPLADAQSELPPVTTQGLHVPVSGLSETRHRVVDPSGHRPVPDPSHVAERWPRPLDDQHGTAREPRSDAEQPSELGLRNHLSPTQCLAGFSDCSFLFFADGLVFERRVGERSQHRLARGRCVGWDGTRAASAGSHGARLAWSFGGWAVHIGRGCADMPAEATTLPHSINNFEMDAAGRMLLHAVRAVAPLKIDPV